MEHGRYTTYTKGACRCDDCRAAQAAYQRDHRARHPPTRPSRRRLQPGYGRALRRLRDAHRDEFDAAELGLNDRR